jgi:polysaccharide biosynthesis transport protein
LDFRQLLTVTRKWIPLLVGGMLAAAVVGFLFSSVQAKTYEAKTTLIVGQSLTSSSPDYAGLLASQQLATTYASIAATRSQLQSAIDTLNLKTTPDELGRRVESVVVTGSSLLTISVQDKDPAAAAAIANTLATGLIEETSPGSGREDDFQASIDAALKATQAQITAADAQVAELLAITTRTAAQDAELATLQGQLVTLRSTYATMLGMSSGAGATNTLAVVDPAVAPTDPIGPRTVLNVLIAALLGLLAAAGIAALAEYRNDRVGAGDQVERLAGASLLASVGNLKFPESWGKYPLATVMAPRSGLAEAYRTLRANLEFATVDRGLKALLVTSAQAGEGKSMTAANIAVAFAQVGQRVLLIDADLRLPAVHDVFGARNEVGLTTALVVDALTLDRIVQNSGQPNLWILTSGPLPPNPAELLSSRRMRALLEHAEAGYDLIVLDSPPIAAVADAALLASSVKNTLLVVDSERGTRRSLSKARDQLTRAGTSIVGVVLNRSASGRGLDEGGQYGGYVRMTMSTAAPGGSPESGGILAPSVSQRTTLWSPESAAPASTPAAESPRPRASRRRS